jgi:hypothetical protein
MAKTIILTELPGDEDRERQERSQPAADADAARRVDELIAQIKTIYFKTKANTIEQDFDRAIDLLKTIPNPEDRQRATVYMDGLAEMRKDWKRRRTRRARS